MTWLKIAQHDSKISIDNLPDADESVSGLVSTFLNESGETLNFGDICCVDANGSAVTSSATNDDYNPAWLMVATASIANNASGSFLQFGYARLDTWSWSGPGVLYQSSGSGNMQGTPPSDGGATIQVVAAIRATNIVFFNPQLNIAKRVT